MNDQEQLRREHNFKMGLQTWLPVSMAAKELGVSTRRVRALLSDCRLLGRQLENGYWEVSFPFCVFLSRRGPRMLANRPKNTVLRVVGK